MTELCDIAYRYGTDKCPQIKHHFTEYYWELFKDRRRDILKVVEIGIGALGFENEMNCKRGASLYMWREFFPNALIYGVDINENLLFSDERIRTFKVDQRSENDLADLVSRVGWDIDLIVEDATHFPDDQIFTCKKLMSQLTNGTTYVIEDVACQNYVLQELGKTNMLDCSLMRPQHRKYKDDVLVLVKRKSIHE